MDVQTIWKFACVAEKAMLLFHTPATPFVDMVA